MGTMLVAFSDFGSLAERASVMLWDHQERTPHGMDV